MNKKDCKIVQDLLPNYIDNLTTTESNEFIEDHLKDCKDCSKVLENMKNDLKTDDEKKDKKVINFIKKYNKKMRVLKFIVLFIIFACVFLIARRAVIMTSLANKSTITSSANKYRMSYIAYTFDRLHSVSTFRKGEQYARELAFTELYQDRDTKIQEFGNGETSNYYIERENEKNKAVLNYEKESILALELDDFCFYKINNKRNIIRNILKTSITTKEENGHKLYYITNIWWDEFGICDLYVSKEGVVEKIIIPNGYIGGIFSGEAIVDVAYSISEESFTDAVFQEPDISEYEIEEQ